jgi:crotonobetainyl-CoA:carnitine CoA-transferase CaiB-like acyl-CoA transferase
MEKESHRCEQALSDVKVIDLTHYIAGPYCTKILADAGADVIKIERPDGGDPARRMGPFKDDDPDLEKSGLFFHLNTNKKSITLNLKNETGKNIFRRLVKDTDVVVENFSPRVMPGLGLSYEELLDVNPRLVMTSISNFGQTGPYRDFKASEIVLCAMGSEMFACGVPDREPLKLGGTVVQYQAGNLASVATLAALFAADNAGKGEHVDLSIMEAHLGSIDRRASSLLLYQYTGQIHGRVPPTLISYPMGVHLCKDGFFDIWGGGIVQAFKFVVDWMGMPELMDEFGSIADQMNPDKEGLFETIFLPWCLERTKLEIWEGAQKARVKLGPINTTEDLFKTQHFYERGFWEDVDHPVMGRTTIPGAPYRMSETPWRINRPAPLLGEHNQLIYGDLGYGPEDLVILREIGAI